MKSVMQTIVRVVSLNKRNWTDTLKPKGIESDYNGYPHIIGNGHMVLGSQMASKAFKFICGIELGKPYVLPIYLGRSSVRRDDGAEGRGYGKKRRSICNGLNRGSKFALTRKGADLPIGALLYERRQTCECR